MQLKHIAILLAIQCSFADERAAGTLSDLVAGSPRVEFHRHPSDKGIVAVCSENQADWWGDVAVFHHAGGKIDGEFKFPAMYEEWKGHHVVSCKWVTLRQVETPVLELIESTHMGNGSIFLFELQGRELRLLLHAKVRGQLFGHLETFGVPLHGTARIKGEHLSVRYAKSDDEKSDSVTLTGMIEIADMADRPMPSRNYEQVCRWDAGKRIFIPAAPTSP